VKDFKELRVWQRAHDLAVAVYLVTRRFPREEIYGLTSQIRVQSALSEQTSPKVAGDGPMAN